MPDASNIHKLDSFALWVAAQTRTETSVDIQARVRASGIFTVWRLCTCQWNDCARAGPARVASTAIAQLGSDVEAGVCETRIDTSEKTTKHHVYQREAKETGWTWFPATAGWKVGGAPSERCEEVLYLTTPDYC